MTITADWQGEVGGLTFGEGTSYPFTEVPLDGFGTPPPRTSDSERGALPGDVGGLDVASRRLLTVTLGLDAVGVPGVSDCSPAAVMSLLDDLKLAWAESAVDVTFQLRLPGMGLRKWYGRPRGVDADLDLLRAGWGEVVCTFEALDPFSYSPPVAVTLNSGNTVVTNPGTAPTDRATIQLTGAGSTPSLTHVSDGRTTRWAAPLTGTRQILLRNRIVTTTGGDDRYSELSPTNQWWDLRPGANTITRTGATAGTITFEPAYW